MFWSLPPFVLLHDELIGHEGNHRVRRDPQEMRRRALVPPQEPFGLERLPQTIKRVRVERASYPALVVGIRRLVVHSSQGRICRSVGYAKYMFG